MRLPSCWSRGLLFLLPFLIASASAARGAGVELVSSDDRGVTLRLVLSDFTVAPPGADGRSRLIATELDMSSLPGRPELPMGAALIALPPEGGVRARVIGVEGEELHEGVRLRIGRRPGFEGDGSPRGTTPIMEEIPAIEDGPWPPAPFQLGEPFTVRRQRLVAVHLHPFRYEAGSRRLWSIRSLTVRLEFQGQVASPGVPADDRHWEPVLKTTVLNYEQGRRWRVPKKQLGLSGESLFPRGRPLPGEGARAGAAFDESEPEVRVQLDTTGVYRLDFDPLASHGYPSGIPVGEVSVHRHEFVQDAPAGTPPYVTLELPIEVVDRDGNGLFGTGDYVLVFVQSWAERSRASIAQRVWGEGEVVYATVLRGGTGRRIASRSGWLGQSLTALASYPWTERFEKNQFYLPVFQIGVADTNTEQFHWTELGQFPSTRADSFRFSVHDIDTTHQAQVSVTWQGRKANSHNSWAHVRNGANQFTSVVDSAYWTGRGSFTSGRTLFGSALTPGFNLLRVWGKTSNSENQVVNAAVNYFDVVYWRGFRPVGGSLSCNSAGATGDFEIRADRFRSPDIRVYDVTDSLNPVRLTLADSLITPIGLTYAVRFQDTSPTGGLRRYLVFANPRTLAAERYQTVTRRRLTERAGGDYLLIVPEAFLPAMDPLVTRRSAQGLNVVVAPLESVNDEFNGGRRSAYAIKRFIRHAYLNWDARFVLLVGDGTEDPHNYTGTAAPDWIPVQRVLAPVGVYDGASNVQEAIASDPWYVWCVEGCPPGPTSPPKLHDLFIGRLPVNSLQQTTDYVNKLVAYENVTPDQTWRREMLLVADDAYSTQSFFGGGNPGDVTYCYRSYEEVFLEINDRIRSLIVNEACLSQAAPEVFDLGEILMNEPRDPNDPFCRESWSGTQQRTQLTVTPNLIQRLNAGKLWWNFQGHANPFVLTHEDLYVNRGSQDNKDLLINDGKPFLFSGFSCHPNQFSTVKELQSNAGPALGEEMTLLPNRGAIASWGSSGFEILPTNAPSHVNVHLARALFAHPPFDPRLGGWEGRVVLGEAIAKALIDNLAATSFSLERDVGISYNLLGDPATSLSVGPPMFAVKANGQPVVNGESVRLFTLGDSLHLQADLGSNLRLKSISLERTDAQGTAVIPASEYILTPAFPDTAANGRGGRCYRLDYRTRLELKSVTYTLRLVDVNDVPGSFDVIFTFVSVLRANGVPLRDGDPVAPNAELSLLVVSPAPIGDPLVDFQLTVDGNRASFVPTQVDTSRREWILTLEDRFPPGEHRVELVVANGFRATKVFVTEVGTAIKNAMAFPNPFDDELGTHFSFTLASDGPADVALRIYTVNGRLIYERSVAALSPGYHQVAWDGLDGERQKLANGVYLFRLTVRGQSGKAVHEGRLVKLRKPRRRDLENNP